MLNAVTDGLGTVVGWIGTVITELTDATNGHLYSLLPLFAIGISISVIFLGVKIVRKICWGA